MVERCHHQLKDELRARSAANDWQDHLPWVLLGMRAALKEDSAVSSAEMVPSRHGVAAVFCDSLGGHRLRSQRHPVTAISGVHRALWGRRRRRQRSKSARSAATVAGVAEGVSGRV